MDHVAHRGASIPRNRQDSRSPPSHNRVVLIHSLPRATSPARPRTSGQSPAGTRLLDSRQLSPGRGVRYLRESLCQVHQVRPRQMLTVADKANLYAGKRADLRLARADRDCSIHRGPIQTFDSSNRMLSPSRGHSPALETLCYGVPKVVATEALIAAISREHHGTLIDGAAVVPCTDPEANGRDNLTLSSDSESAATDVRRTQEQALLRFGFETIVDRIELLYAELVIPQH